MTMTNTNGPSNTNMDDARLADLRRTALEYEEAAAEFEAVVKHLRIAADHFRDGNIPRGSAHAWAAAGNASNGDRKLRELAEFHASRSPVD